MYLRSAVAPGRAAWTLTTEPRETRTATGWGEAAPGGGPSWGGEGPALNGLRARVARRAARRSGVLYAIRAGGAGDRAVRGPRGSWAVFCPAELAPRHFRDQGEFRDAGQVKDVLGITHLGPAELGRDGLYPGSRTGGAGVMSVGVISVRAGAVGRDHPRFDRRPFLGAGVV